MTATIRTETRRQRIQKLKEVNTKKLPLSFCVPNLNIETNFSVLVRTAVALGFKAGYVIGSQGPEARAASAHTIDLINLQKFSSTSAFLEFRRLSRLKLVCIEKTDFSVAIESAHQILDFQTLSDNDEICLFLGNETFGVPEDIILNADLVVHIPMLGPVPCMNVASAGSIAFWEFSKKIIEKGQ